MDAGIENPSGNRISGSLVVAVLVLLLVAAGVIGYLGWTISNADVPMSGYVAMALGVFFFVGRWCRPDGTCVLQ
ncbi:hypothetical protein [Bradyrhizobium prioriisuperbiae]|uniref:hypothetical protein n=1 Tax=Bradyrhizobium prioriisuperbiae TaxID=2854389 RepID=UPI0028ED148C|nr:hypothetical protein [Bradyrhizobium prioritasuperba]